MLDLIRKKQKSVVVKVVFWAIIATFIGTIFLVWGKGSDGTGQGATVAATVNGTPISFDEYQSAYSNLYRLYQNIYRDQFSPALEKQLGLRKQALDTVLDQTLLLQEAQRQGLKISKKELVDAIAQIPAFQSDGAFDKERYLQILSYQRLTPDTFEEMQKRQMLGEKVQEQVRGQVTVSMEEIEQEYRDTNEKVNLAFLRLTPGLFESRVEIDADALNAFFAEQRETFRLPEQRALRYLEFVPARYQEEVTFTQAELDKYYRRNLDQFEIFEQVKAAHVLIKVDEKADEATRATKRELAGKILEEARSGKDFAALAKKYSDDPGSAQNGGDLGYFSRGSMVPAFEETAFALNPGDLSDIVETPFGFHIIKVEGYIEPGVKPLDEVLETVKAGLKVEKARTLAMEKAMDAYNINRKGGDLDTAAKANNLGIKETGLFALDQPIDGIGSAPELAAAAFALAEGELARPIAYKDSIFLLTVKERRESRLPELAEVKAQVEEAFRKDRSQDLARETATRLLTEAQAGTDLERLGKKHDLKVEETGLFTRSYGSFLPRLGTSESLAKQAFELSKESSIAGEVFDIDGKYVIAALKERQEADPKGLDVAKRAELETAIATRKQDEALQARLDELKAAAEITIAPTILSAIEGK